MSQRRQRGHGGGQRARPESSDGNAQGARVHGPRGCDASRPVGASVAMEQGACREAGPSKARKRRPCESRSREAAVMLHREPERVAALHCSGSLQSQTRSKRSQVPARHRRCPPRQGTRGPPWAGPQSLPLGAAPGKPKASARQQPGGRTARRCVEAALRCSVRAVLRDAIDHQHGGVLRCAVALKLRCATPCRSCAALQRAMLSIKSQPAQTDPTHLALAQTIASVLEGVESILRI